MTPPATPTSGLLVAIERLTDAGQSLSFVVTLAQSVEGVDLRVGSVAAGTLYIDCDSLRAFVRLARTKRTRFPRVSRTLASAGVTAEVVLDGRTVAVLGSGVEPGILAGRAGYGQTALCPRNLTVATVRAPVRRYREWRSEG